ncbi:hypothetical protein B0H13DRAFT_2303677 [Mycena leptocephala]|nr:hypothetical protein B0H13DRAFT_2303677 [Mycena leptocephala]
MERKMQCDVLSKSSIRRSFNSYLVLLFLTSFIQDPNFNYARDIRSWPVPIECQEALKAIHDTHAVREFVVFDTDNTRIDPVDIPGKLEEALVEGSFHLDHHSFPIDDSFSGIIQRVVILRPRPAKAASPFKASASKPYRPSAMTTAAIHAEQQLAVKHFTTPLPTAGPSNLPYGS